MSSRERSAYEWIALGIVAAIAIPMVALGGMAFADGELRRHEAPLRAFLGRDAFEAHWNGDDYPQHYMHLPPMPRPLTGMPAVFDPRRTRRAPDFTLSTQTGAEWSMSAHRGRVLVINFWSVTCPPCVAEMPSLETLARILGDRDDVELVTIATDREWSQVRTVVDPDSPLTVLLDPDRNVANNVFGTQQFPETWIIDPDGIVRLRIDGQRDWSNALAIEIIESYR